MELQVMTGEAGQMGGLAVNTKGLTMKKLQVVTGGTVGMGFAAAKELGKYGPVMICGRNADRLGRALSDLRIAGVEAYGQTCDVSSLSDVQALANEAVQIAPIGNVVNSAGINFYKATIEEVLQIDLMGTINVNKTFFPLMNDGTILNFSSLIAHFYKPSEEEMELWSNPDAEDFFERFVETVKKQGNQMPQLGEAYPAYGAAKRFVIYYTTANAARYGLKNVRSLSISPGVFDTPMNRGFSMTDAEMESSASGTAFKRVGTAEEMGTLVRLLLDPSIKYLTGVDVLMDGGKYAMSVVKQI
jgi:NAD(P)-dependent dehydrogenase (short-subunit alcohol dehydrogenase family)